MEIVYGGIGAAIFSIYLIIDTQVKINYDVENNPNQILFRWWWEEATNSLFLLKNTFLQV